MDSFNIKLHIVSKPIELVSAVISMLEHNTQLLPLHLQVGVTVFLSSVRTIPGDLWQVFVLVAKSMSNFITQPWYHYIDASNTKPVLLFTAMFTCRKGVKMKTCIILKLQSEQKAFSQPCH